MLCVLLVVVKIIALHSILSTPYSINSGVKYKKKNPGIQAPQILIKSVVINPESFILRKFLKLFKNLLLECSRKIWEASLIYGALTCSHFVLLHLK